MRPISEQLTDLTARARDTEAAVAAARDRDMQRLEQRKSQLRTAVTEANAAAHTSLDHARESLRQKLDQLRGNLQQARDTHDVKQAERRAERAEQDAADAIDFALYAFDEAEWTAIDAVLAGRPVDANQKPSIGCSIKWKPGNAPA